MQHQPQLLILLFTLPVAATQIANHVRSSSKDRRTWVLVLGLLLLAFGIAAVPFGSNWILVSAVGSLVLTYAMSTAGDTKVTRPQVMAISACWSAFVFFLLAGLILQLVGHLDDGLAALEKALQKAIK